MAEIYKLAAERHKAIRNVKVESVITWKKIMDVPSRKFTAASLVGYKCTFAFDKELRFLKRVPLEKVSEGAANMPSTYSYDGKSTYVTQVGSIMIQEQKAPGCENGEYYCTEFLDIPITDSDRAQYDNAWFYPHCLRSDLQSFYTVLPQLEQVDGAWCHVLFRDKRDKIWVDPKLGGAYRRRDRYNEATGGKVVLMCRYSTSDFVEAAPSIWVPKRCTRLDFAPAANPPNYWNKPYLELHVDVEKVAVNQVTNEDFNISVPPGTIVVDKNGSFALKGNKEYLLNELAEQASVQRRQGGLLRGLFWALVLGITIGVGVLSHYFYKRHKKQPSIGRPPGSTRFSARSFLARRLVGMLNRWRVQATWIVFWGVVLWRFWLPGR